VEPVLEGRLGVKAKLPEERRHVAVVAALLAYEHTLVRPDDLRRLNAAFFTMNGVISVVFAAFVILDVTT